MGVTNGDTSAPLSHAQTGIASPYRLVEHLPNHSVGRPSKYPVWVQLDVRTYREFGWSIREIAKHLNVPRSTVGRWVKP